MILVIDNYDSFTYNLVQYLGEMQVELQVHRNDQITIGQIRDSSGTDSDLARPCSPRESGLSNEIIRTFGPEIRSSASASAPVHRARVRRNVIVNYRMMHGKVSPIKHNGKDLFAACQSVRRTRYTRWSSSATRSRTAWRLPRDRGGRDHGRQAQQHPIWGVQFHPRAS